MRLNDVVAMHSDPEAKGLGWDLPCPATYYLCDLEKDILNTRRLSFPSCKMGINVITHVMGSFLSIRRALGYIALNTALGA